MIQLSTVIAPKGSPERKIGCMYFKWQGEMGGSHEEFGEGILSLSNKDLKEYRFVIGFPSVMVCWVSLGEQVFILAVPMVIHPPEVETKNIGS